MDNCHRQCYKLRAEDDSTARFFLHYTSIRISSFLTGMFAETCKANIKKAKLACMMPGIVSIRWIASPEPLQRLPQAKPLVHQLLESQ